MTSVLSHLTDKMTLCFSYSIAYYAIANAQLSVIMGPNFPAFQPKFPAAIPGQLMLDAFSCALIFT